MDNYAMMVDCPEIQGQWEPKEGDRYSSRIIGHEGIYTLPRDFAPDMKAKAYNGIIRWLPRQEDWQNILFTEHYAPAIPTAKRVRAAIMIMFREHVDYMEGWKIDQPCEAWARLYMNFHNKTWEKGEWV